MPDCRDDLLAQAGFRFGRSGVHQARSMMLADLRSLLEACPSEATTPDAFANAILLENCLGKRSVTSRRLSLKHLRSLYALDPGVPIYRFFRFLWCRMPDERPLLALLIAYARDPVLRDSAPRIISMPPGDQLPFGAMETFLESLDENRYSPATLKSTACNVRTSWTHSGHLSGNVIKRRATAEPGAGSVALALLLGYLVGHRGMLLFESEYMRLLDATTARKNELAQTASKRGWLVFKQIGSIVEVLFPGVLTDKEQERIREQG